MPLWPWPFAISLLFLPSRGRVYFPIFFIYAGLVTFFYQYGARSDVLGLLRPTFRRLFASAFTQKHHNHHVKKSRVSCYRDKPDREVLWDKKQSEKGGLVKETKSTGHVSPTHTKKRNISAVLACPIHFAATQCCWQTYEWSHLESYSLGWGQPWKYNYGAEMSWAQWVLPKCWTQITESKNGILSYQVVWGFIMKQ